MPSIKHHFAAMQCVFHMITTLLQPMQYQSLCISIMCCQTLLDPGLHVATLKIGPVKQDEMMPCFMRDMICLSAYAV